MRQKWNPRPRSGNGDLVAYLGASEDAQKDVDLGARPEKEAALDGAAGDGDEGPGLG